MSEEYQSPESSKSATEGRVHPSVRRLRVEIATHAGNIKSWVETIERINASNDDVVPYINIGYMMEEAAKLAYQVGKLNGIMISPNATLSHEEGGKEQQ